ncbi:pyruvate ferredoxin oxidoreductase subunit gamma [Methanococcus aeolicus]|jgi:pyruvate ferredoxin oxidoreductase gamma subunit|uniref:Pyruvate synthase subunit PorC n=1 Tax=Methanococcus aeolicus (strain ATCC BAA-1280 / DSM 17508 / OCM 812 / Nankai-3) TaxID=419665 RepID=A6UWI5_META3|nr:pyruvate ferredoxin oxidoreductase subunit gamma [Methanococcus aeolicus]ABR56857.1 pyruvate/ketoisovalerate oxidoreductase, gamma subunit [Methanococcus aeolicus Nankai-3]UXM84858.1 pyruvate ferredoxin oxidoreductase subunit gamma [Methanococcus aeolicus]
MIEVRFHGRGGQGAVTAAQLLAKATFIDGNFAQAFPFFGVERRGAPVIAFTRIDDKKIRIRSQIYEPDYVVVQDPSLLDSIDVKSGLKEGGKIIINTTKDIKFEGYDVFCVDATGIALDVLGLPIVNTSILGAFAGVTGEVSIEALKEAIMDSFPKKLAEKNAKAAEVAYNAVKK